EHCFLDYFVAPVPFRPAPSVLYQSTLSPSCTWRGSYADVIVPNVAALRLLAGGAKLTRLNRLNASTRNCNFARPAIAMFLVAAASNWRKFGPRTLFRGALPNGWLGSVGRVTHAVLNQFVIDCAPSGAEGSQVTFGRWFFAPE